MMSGLARSSSALKQELRKQRPTVKLLYVTPEQLIASAALDSVLQDLQKRGLLARFVVDEVLPLALTCNDFSLSLEEEQLFICWRMTWNWHS
jgi:bloom syndrome protein